MSRRLLLLACLALAACAAAPRVHHDDIASALHAIGTDAALPAGEAGEPPPPGALSDARDAVAFALRHHPRVHAVLAELDGAAAMRWQAGLAPDPMASAMALRREGGGWMLEYGLMQSLFALLDRPQRIAEAEAALRRAEAETVAALLALAREAEDAWVASVAQGERAALLAEDLALAEQLHALSEAQAGAGAVGLEARLRVAMERAEAEDRLAAARAALVRERSRLAEALGLAGAGGLQLPARLPEPPLQAIDAEALHALARSRRPELRAAEAERERTGVALRRSDRSGGIDAIDLGLRRQQDAFGPELRIALPLFDRGQARRASAAARARAAQAEQALAERGVAREVERALARLALDEQRLRATRERARHAELRAALAARLHAQGSAPYDERLRSEREVRMAGMALMDAREAVWQSLLALAAATASALPTARED
ncbi:TolC family protein [Rehaibacterium terrae]|jgi:cobalt-zinc-cadmium efflux system outer membrane protein|uniref:Outer membrane protein TolC n=1 Tax=Rehaibacterium terrae TaxID=1341696 RepID=A0A7W7Y0Q1_9GAMM|nr:TolC family protein [Rehaibacterium terrae]MBB5015974.1 outer membrane protein TolC [Rehaibacterium terrae]